MPRSTACRRSSRRPTGRSGRRVPRAWCTWLSGALNSGLDGSSAKLTRMRCRSTVARPYGTARAGDLGEWWSSRAAPSPGAAPAGARCRRRPAPRVVEPQPEAERAGGCGQPRGLVDLRRAGPPTARSRSTPSGSRREAGPGRRASSSGRSGWRRAGCRARTSSATRTRPRSTGGSASASKRSRRPRPASRRAARPRRRCRRRSTPPRPRSLDPTWNSCSAGVLRDVRVRAARSTGSGSRQPSPVGHVGERGVDDRLRAPRPRRPPPARPASSR